MARDLPSPFLRRSGAGIWTKSAGGVTGPTAFCHQPGFYFCWDWFGGVPIHFDESSKPDPIAFGWDRHRLELEIVWVLWNMILTYIDIILTYIDFMVSILISHVRWSFGNWNWVHLQDFVKNMYRTSYKDMARNQEAGWHPDGILFLAAPNMVDMSKQW